MHQRDKAIKDITRKEEMIEIIRKCKFCHVGFVDDNIPYVLGFNFGYENDTIYLHGAKQGRKYDIIKKNNNVSVMFDTDHEFFHRHEEVACSYRMRYRSVLAFGKAYIVEDEQEKIKALNIIMKQYTNRSFEYSKPAINNVGIICIKVEKMTGRKFEYL